MDNNYAEDIFHLLRHCNNLVQRLIHWEHQNPRAELIKMGIRGQQGLVLRTLLENDGITQKSLTESLRITSSSAGELLCKLEQNGYIKRCSSASDKRTFNLYLTEDGRAAAEDYNKIRDATVKEWASDLSVKDQKHFVDLLTKLSNSLEKRLSD